MLIDNYDSFVHNLDRFLKQWGQETIVVRSDAIDVDSIRGLGCDGIIISPGPKTPSEAGCSMDVVRLLGESIPILGVCLGHQAIGQALGGRVVRAPKPIHGMSSLVHHFDSSILNGLPSPFRAGRYHSLIVDERSLPSCLKKTAWTEDNLIMAIEHYDWPLVGVQFHPESILTDHGHQIIYNFLKLCQVDIAPEFKQNAPKGDLPISAN